MQNVLSVGDVARRRAGLGVVGSLGLVAAFTAVTVVSKELPVLNVRQPWQDDPYDVLVSLDFVVLPFLIALGGLRVLLCRQFEVLPARRLVDLLRVASTALWVCLATELAEWVPVLLRRHRSVWNENTAWQVALLAALSFATFVALVSIRRSSRRVARMVTVAVQPDWLSDAVALGLRSCRFFGRRESTATMFVQMVDARLITRVRAHPVGAAACVAGLLSAPLLAPKIIIEGYSLPLVLVVSAFVTASLFALVVIGGAHLRIVEPRHSTPPPWVSATVVACICGATAFAFHDSLLVHQTTTGLGLLLFGGGFVAGLSTLLAQTVRRQTAR